MVNKLKIKYKQNVALFALEKKNTILFYKLSIFFISDLSLYNPVKEHADLQSLSKSY